MHVRRRRQAARRAEGQTKFRNDQTDGRTRTGGRARANAWEFANNLTNGCDAPPLRGVKERRGGERANHLIGKSTISSHPPVNTRRGLEPWKRENEWPYNRVICFKTFLSLSLYCRMIVRPIRSYRRMPDASIAANEAIIDSGGGRSVCARDDRSLARCWRLGYWRAGISLRFTSHLTIQG